MELEAQVHYRVENVCGGMVYFGESLEQAILATGAADAVPYVCAGDGFLSQESPIRRPVVRYELDGVEEQHLGEPGESYDECRERLRDELARYEDRASVP